MGTLVKAAEASEIAVNQGKTVTVNGKSIALFNVGGKFCAIDNTCVHRGGPLGEGDLQGTIVTCPWHGWQYDVSTGVSPVNPMAKVTSYPCKVDGADILVEV